MPDEPRYDGYFIDGVAYRNLMRVKEALYRNDYKRLTGDEIRDLANAMDANLRGDPIGDPIKDET